MSKKLQMQRGTDLLQTLLFHIARLSADEQIVLVKAVSGELGEPLYTRADVKRIVAEEIHRVQQRQDLNRQIQRLPGGLHGS